MVRVPSKFPVETRTELAEYEHLGRQERIVACYLHLWRAEGWRPTGADVAVCAGVSESDAIRRLKRASLENSAIIFPDESIPSGSIPRGLQMATDRAAAMVTLIITNLTPTYVHGALLSGPKGPAFPTHAITQEAFTRYVLQNIAPLPFDYDPRRKDRMHRYAESCVALIRETANMLHTSPPAAVPAAVQSWLLRYDTFMSSGSQSSAAATPTPTLASNASPATATTSLASSSFSAAASGGGGEAAAGGGLTIGASLEASLPASPLAVGPTSTIAAAAASDGGGAASSSTSTSARYTYTPSELTTRSVNRNAFAAMLVPYASIKRVRAEESPPPCSPDCTMHARASAGKIPNAELVSHMMKTKCRITSTEKLQTAMSVPMPTDLYFLKSGVGQTTYARKSPKKESTKVQLQQTKPAPPLPPPQQQPQPVTPRKRTFSQSLQDLSNEASPPGNSQPKRAAKGSEQ